MRSAIQTLLACAGFLVATGGPVQAGVITVTSQWTETYVVWALPDYPYQDYVHDYYNGTALDSTDHTVSVVVGESWSSATTNLSEQPLGATFSYSYAASLDEATAYGMNGYAIHNETFGFVNFTADAANLSYSLLGNYFYQREESDTGSVFVNFQGWLIDLTAGTSLFLNAQSSFFTNPISLALGGSFYDGNVGSAYLEGSLNGTLIAGHEYEFGFYADSREGTLSVSGDTMLTITSEPSAVPEPASLSLFALGTLGMGFVVRRRRRFPASLCAV